MSGPRSSRTNKAFNQKFKKYHRKGSKGRVSHIVALNLMHTARETCRHHGIISFKNHFSSGGDGVYVCSVHSIRRRRK